MTGRLCCHGSEARTLTLGQAGHVAMVVKLGHSRWDKQAMLPW